jgi:4Fe-4S ferredoxin
MPEARTVTDCREVAGKLAPVVDRNRCEGSADCVRVCPFNVFEIRKLTPQERSQLSFVGKIKAWAHGGNQAEVARAADCHACRRCIDACPEHALELNTYSA